MKIFLFLIALTGIFLENNSYAMQDDVLSVVPAITVEKLRAGYAFEKIDISTIPVFETAQDYYQFCGSLIQSEINFWKGSQEEICKMNPRLRILVKLLSVKKDESSPFDPKHALEALNLRFKLLNNQSDSDWYDIYTSYSTIIRDLDLLLEYFQTFELYKIESKQHRESEFLRFVINRLLDKSDKIRDERLLTRGVIHAPVSGKSINQIIKEQSGKFNKDVSSGLHRYSHCDVEYVSEIFMTTLCEIMAKGETFLLQKEGQKLVRENDLNKNQGHAPSEESKQPPKITKSQKRAKRRKKVTIEGHHAGVEKTAIDQLVSAPSLIDALTCEVLPVQANLNLPSLCQEDQPAASTGNDPEISKAGSETTLKVTAGVDLLSSSAEKLTQAGADAEMRIVPSDEASKSILTSPEEFYDLKPWEKYKKEDEKSTIKNETNPLFVRAIIPSAFMLGEEHSSTARMLLGLATSKDKLEMRAYIKLVEGSTGLRGNVLRNKHSLHFSARSLVDQHWRSVSMHILHQDDPTVIPRKTRYWQIAKQLLLDVGLGEDNLYTLTL